MTQSQTSDTSLQAYLQKKEDGSLTKDQERVYKTVEKHGPISCKSTARRLNKFPNEISGRFTELREKDLIEIDKVENGHRQYKVTR